MSHTHTQKAGDASIHLVSKQSYHIYMPRLDNAIRQSEFLFLVHDLWTSGVFSDRPNGPSYYVR